MLEERSFEAPEFQRPNENIPLALTPKQSAAAPSRSSELLDDLADPQVETALPTMSKSRSIIVVLQMSGINFMASVSSGLLTVGIPRMAADLNLVKGLLLWPSAVYALTSGSCLLLAGSIADVVGSRSINLAGCFLLGCFTIACGFAMTGIQLVMFRAFQGIAVALHLPTSVSIVARSMARGKARNVSFSCLGLAQPLGFSVGLVMEGVIQDTAGWRVGWYICGGGCLLLFAIGFGSLPPDPHVRARAVNNLLHEIDWVGATMASASLAILSYVLAMITSDLANIRRSSTVILLSISLLLAPAFAFWVQRQEKHKKPALIPNSLWKNGSFTSICLMVLLSYGVMQSMELFCSLFFQDVQHLSALQTSIRLLPSLVVGAVLNLTTGFLVHKISAFWLVLVTSGLSVGAPLLMALSSSHGIYWYNPFFAQLLEPLSADVLFTVGMLIVSDAFPENTQALAGGVFNTVAQFGSSLGLAVMAVISGSVTKGTSYSHKGSPEALMVGYRATFWTAVGWMLATCVISLLGLRKVGKVGLKRD